MALPPDIHDPNRNYRIRICVKIADNPLAGFITDSKVHVCDSCGEPIWVREAQEIPDAEVRIDGDLELCLPCYEQVVADDPQPPQFLGPVPPGFPGLT